MREWKVAIHVSRTLYLIPSLLLSFCQRFFFLFTPFRFLWLSVLLSFLPFQFGFLSPFFFPLFCLCFLVHVISSFNLSNLLKLKGLIIVVVG
jgi:hypothetical protein